MSSNPNQKFSIMNELYGLVLAGGKSLRMGKDKSQIDYHGIPQSIFLYNMLENLCDKVFLSIREEQKDAYEVPFIVDQNRYRGPFNGLLSAHDLYPERSWLVIACDLPLIDLESLELLIRERDAGKMATAMATKKSGLPEPLVAIWEAESLKKAPAYLAQTESSCPRKYLLNSEIKLVYPESDSVLLNSNSEEDYQEVMRILSAT